MSAEPKWTPGPWTFDPDHGESWFKDDEYTVDAEHIAFLEVHGAGNEPIVEVKGPCDETVIDEDDDDFLKWPASDEQAIANAHLIAAAPELYASLEWYAENARLSRLIHSEGDAGRQAIANDGGEKARSVLAKARGEA